MIPFLAYLVGLLVAENIYLRREIRKITGEPSVLELIYNKYKSRKMENKVDEWEGK